MADRRDDPLERFDADYPTMSCLLRLTVIGVILLFLAFPIVLWVLRGVLFSP